MREPLASEQPHGQPAVRSIDRPLGAILERSPLCQSTITRSFESITMKLASFISTFLKSIDWCCTRTIRRTIFQACRPVQRLSLRRFFAPHISRTLINEDFKAALREAPALARDCAARNRKQRSPERMASLTQIKAPTRLSIDKVGCFRSCRPTGEKKLRKVCSGVHSAHRVWLANACRSGAISAAGLARNNTPEALPRRVCTHHCRRS